MAAEENKPPEETLASIKIGDIVKPRTEEKPAPLISEIIKQCLWPFLFAFLSGILGYSSFDKMVHPKVFMSALTPLVSGGIWFLLLGSIAYLLCFIFSMLTLARLGRVLDKRR